MHWVQHTAALVVLLLQHPGGHAALGVRCQPQPRHAAVGRGAWRGRIASRWAAVAEAAGTGATAATG
eukprot:1161629-Pelagomonas_calceolata.AAC.7